MSNAVKSLNTVATMIKNGSLEKNINNINFVDVKQYATNHGLTIPADRESFTGMVGEMDDCYTLTKVIFDSEVNDIFVIVESDVDNITTFGRLGNLLLGKTGLSYHYQISSNQGDLDELDEQTLNLFADFIDDISVKLRQRYPTPNNINGWDNLD